MKEAWGKGVNENGTREKKGAIMRAGEWKEE